MKKSIILVICMILAGCNGTKFSGSGARKTSDTGSESPPAAPTTTPEAPKPCLPGQTKLGGYIAFLVDNSNSNAETDCPSPKENGKLAGSTLYQCAAATNREKAVLSAFDTLAEVSAASPEALSRLSVASFPTKEDYLTGWKAYEPKWLASEKGNDKRQALTSLLQFTREPVGMTPYGAAMTAGLDLFKGVPSGDNPKLAVLVTDGEPTDQDPTGVAAQAAELKKLGVEVITVFVTDGKTREQRLEQHTRMIRSYEQSAKPRHWYNEAHYSSLDEYLDHLLGRSGKKSLVQEISAKIVEVQDSSALAEVFRQIVKEKTTQCQP